MKRHNYMIHSKVEIVFELCDFKMKTKQGVYTHKGRCKGGSLRDFKCDECEFTIHAVNEHLGYMKMQQHIRSKHEGLLYTCDVCEFNTQYKTNLDQHKYVHSAKTFKCVSCQYIASTKRALTRHIQNIHFEKNFHCKQCNFSGGSLPQINNHTRKSHKPKQEKMKLQWDKCDIKCSRLDALKLHKKGKHEEWTHACIHCDFKTSTPHKLKGHLKIIHNEGDLRLLQCDLCDFKCLDKSGLVDHSRSKHRKNPLLCLICGGKYFDRKTFKDHVKKHTRNWNWLSQNLNAQYTSM